MAPEYHYEEEEEDVYLDGDSDDGVPQLDHEDTLTIEDESGVDESQPAQYGNATAYLALEASEADSDASSRASLDIYGAVLDDSFPRFMELPPEVREMIWNEFCPDLRPRPRVFEFICSNLRDMILASQVHDQTAPMRAVLAVHHESRVLALKSSPDRIELPHGNGVVPYHKGRDVVFLVSDPPHTSGAREALALAANMAPGFQQLALQAGAEPKVDDILDVLPGLRNIFIFVDNLQTRTKYLAWCVSEAVHEYHVEMIEEEDYGFSPQYIEMVFCFPDTEAYVDPGEEQLPDRDSDSINLEQTGDSENLDEALEDNALENVPPWGYTHFEGDPFLFDMHPHEKRSWPRRRQSRDERAEEGQVSSHESLARHIPRVWPMVRFMFDSGIEHLAEMKTWQHSWDDWKSDYGPADTPGNEDESEDMDEYESEGIDDDPIDEDLYPTDEEDDLPAHLLDDDDVDVDVAFGMVNATQARFSSDPDESDQDDGVVQARNEEDLRNRAARLQRQALESDSDEDSNTEDGKTHHGTNRRRRVISDESDNDGSDDEQETGPSVIRAGQKRPRAVLIDSEDEDNQHPVQPSESGSEQGSRPSRATNRRARPAIPSGSEDEEDDAPQPGEEVSDGSSSSDQDEESSDEDPPPPKRVSLAKRLQMEYQQSRSGHRATDASDEESYGSDGVSDDEDEEDASEGVGMVMSMADLGNEDEEDDEDEGW